MPDRSYAEGINTQRIALAANLTTMGVSSVGTESLTDLVAKVESTDTVKTELVKLEPIIKYPIIKDPILTR